MRFAATVKIISFLSMDQKSPEPIVTAISKHIVTTWGLGISGSPYETDKPAFETKRSYLNGKLNDHWIKLMNALIFQCK